MSNLSVKQHELENFIGQLDPVLEVGRPQGYSREFISGPESLENLNLHIKSTDPKTGQEIFVNRLDPLNVTLTIESPKPIVLRNVSAWVYTCLMHMDNFEGVYREVQLKYDETSRQWNDYGRTTYTYSTVLYPTEVGHFKLTYNVKVGDAIVWANVQDEDATVNIIQERSANKWVSDSTITPITKVLNVGSAGCLTPANGFRPIGSKGEYKEIQHYVGGTEYDAVFSLDRNIVIQMENNNFLQLPQASRAGVEIPKLRLELIVNALRKLTDTRSRVLIVDTPGILGVGSALTAFIYANNPSLSFDEAFDFVNSRRPICCKKGLRATVEELFPRV